MKTKRLCVVFLTILVVAFLIGSMAEARVLRFAWHETDPRLMRFIEKTVAEYKGMAGVEIKIEPISVEDLWPKLQMSISGGRPYDLATIGYIGYVAMLAERNQIESLDDIINVFGRDDFLPKILFPYKDKVWWMPYDYNAGVLYIRTDLFRQKGLPIPKTWDDLLTAAKTLTEGDRYGIVLCLGENGCNGAFWSPLLWGNGVELFDKDWNVILDSPQIKPRAVEVLNYTKELYKYMPPGSYQGAHAQMLSFFSTGKVAIGTYAGRLAHHIEDKAPDLVGKFQIIGFPTKDGKKAAVGLAYDGFIVPKGPNSKEAKEFLLWFSKNRMAELNSILPAHLLPTQKSVFNDPKYRESEGAKRLWKSSIQPQYDLMNTGILDNVDTQGPYMDPLPGEVLNASIIKDMVLSVLLKDTPPEKAVEEAAKKIRDLKRK